MHNVISRNGFFGHHENIILSLLADESSIIRELGLRRVKRAREDKLTQKNGVRKFIIPKINLDANSATELVDWTNSPRTEPPLLTGIEDLDAAFASNTITSLCKKLPCLTQAVERAVKLVTEASKSVCGSAKRNGVIMATLLSREKRPIFETKKQFAL